MLPKGTLSLVAAVGLVTSLPVTAAASQTAFGIAPVTVSACDTDTTLASSSPYQVPRPATSVHYRFVNNAGVPAQAVTFDVTLGGQSSSITERGSFAPGVGIDRQSSEYTDAFSAGPAACRVTQVDFRDGSTWRANSEAKVTARN